MGKDKELEIEKNQLFSRLKHLVDPKHLEKLNETVKNIDDKIVLTFGLMLFYGGKGDIKFMEEIERAVTNEITRI